MANIDIQESDIENNEQPVDTIEDTPEVPEQVIAPAQLRRGPGKVVLLIIFVLIISLVTGLVLVLKDRNHLKNEVSKLSQSQPSATDDAKQLNSEVGKLIELPTDETPTVATVVDASKVKSQAFFANAQNGDRVLLYSKSSKAILYRPSTKKIIEVAPINIGANQTQTGTTTNKK